MKTLPLLLLLCTQATLCAQLEVPVEDLTKDKRVTWNKKDRDEGVTIDRVVIHGAASVKSPDGKKMNAPKHWFDPERRIDAYSKYNRGPHYMIDRLGNITQFVPHDRVSLHSTVYNSRSIGVELIGLGDDPFTSQFVKEKLTDSQRATMKPYTDAQYTALDRLLAKLAKEFEGMKAILNSDIEDRARSIKIVSFRDAPDGEERGTLPQSRLVRLFERTEHEGEVWYRARDDGPKQPDRIKGWISASSIMKQARNFDPGSQFDRTKIKSMPLVGKDDF